MRPFVYGYDVKRDKVTWSKIYKVNKTKIIPIHFFVHGPRYKFWNIFWTDIHFFGGENEKIFIFGTDHFGRDLFTLNLYATRTSLTIGLIGVALSFVLGSILGGLSGYFGGRTDMIIQRIIEFLISIPTIPLSFKSICIPAAILPKVSAKAADAPPCNNPYG